MLIVAQEALPARTCKELVAWLKANPDKATLGTIGVGSAGASAAIYFQKHTGTTSSSCPIAAARRMQDLIAGQIDLTVRSRPRTRCRMCATARSRPTR